MKPASGKRMRAWAETRFSNFQLANSGGGGAVAQNVLKRFSQIVPDGLREYRCFCHTVTSPPRGGGRRLRPRRWQTGRAKQGKKRQSKMQSSILMNKTTASTGAPRPPNIWGGEVYSADSPSASSARVRCCGDHQSPRRNRQRFGTGTAKGWCSSAASRSR